MQCAKFGSIGLVFSSDEKSFTVVAALRCERYPVRFFGLTTNRT